MNWFWFWGGGAPIPPSTATLNVALNAFTVSGAATHVSPAPSSASLIAGSATDNFNGTSGNSLETWNPLWVVHPSYSTGSGIITSGGRVRPGNANVVGYYLNVDPATADQRVSGKMVRLSALAGSEQCYLAARMSTSADTMYLGGYIQTGNWTLLRRVAGSSTTLGSSAATLTQDQIYTVELRAIGSSISLFVDGVQVIGPITDTNITAAGRCGLRMNRSTGTGDTSGLQFDDFTATAPYHIRDLGITGVAAAATPPASTANATITADSFTVSAAASSGGTGPISSSLAVTLANATVAGSATYTAPPARTATASVSLDAFTVAGSAAFAAAGSRTATLTQSLGGFTVTSSANSAAPGSASATSGQSLASFTVAANAGVVLSGTGANLGVLLDGLTATGTATRTLAAASLASLGITVANWSLSATATTALMVGPGRLNAIPHRSNRITAQRRAADLD